MHILSLSMLLVTFISAICLSARSFARSSRLTLLGSGSVTELDREQLGYDLFFNLYYFHRHCSQRMFSILPGKVLCVVGAILIKGL